MRGDRAHYGHGKEGLRVTLRIYGEERKHVEALAAQAEASPADVIGRIVALHARRRLREDLLPAAGAPAPKQPQA